MTPLDIRRQLLRRTADPLADAVGRVLRPRATRDRPDSTADAAVAGLAQRLDDRGCASGRVWAARQEELSRAFDRLEAKLNAILVAVTATFVSTLLGLATLVVRTYLLGGAG